jgi:hypothetical protein
LAAALAQINTAAGSQQSDNQPRHRARQPRLTVSLPRQLAAVVAVVTEAALAETAVSTAVAEVASTVVALAEAASMEASLAVAFTVVAFMDASRGVGSTVEDFTADFTGVRL